MKINYQKRQYPVNNSLFKLLSVLAKNFYLTNNHVSNINNKQKCLFGISDEGVRAEQNP